MTDKIRNARECHWSVPSAQHPWYVVAAGHVCLHHYPVSQARRPAPVRERTVHKPPKGIVFT